MRTDPSPAGRPPVVYSAWPVAIAVLCCCLAFYGLLAAGIVWMIAGRPPGWAPVPCLLGVYGVFLYVWEAWRAEHTARRAVPRG